MFRKLIDDSRRSGLREGSQLSGLREGNRPLGKPFQSRWVAQRMGEIAEKFRGASVDVLTGTRSIDSEQSEQHQK